MCALGPPKPTGCRGQQSENYSWSEWKILFFSRDQQQRGLDVRSKPVNLVALWETVTLCHTLLALALPVRVTNKTVRKRDAKPIIWVWDLSVCVSVFVVWVVRSTEAARINIPQNTLNLRGKKEKKKVLLYDLRSRRIKSELLFVSAFRNETNRTDHSASNKHCGNRGSLWVANYEQVE